MFVSDWMTKRVFTVSPDDSITDAVKLMRKMYKTCPGA